MRKRLAQASHLLRCSVQVLLHGPLPTFDADPRFVAAIRAVMDAAESEPLDKTGVHELQRALAHIGLFTRVAATEGLPISHVVQVAKGQRTSKRVIEAIVCEVRRIERSSERAI